LARQALTQPSSFTRAWDRPWWSLSLCQMTISNRSFDSSFNQAQNSMLDCCRLATGACCVSRAAAPSHHQAEVAKSIVDFDWPARKTSGCSAGSGCLRGETGRGNAEPTPHTARQLRRPVASSNQLTAWRGSFGGRRSEMGSVPSSPLRALCAASDSLVAGTARPVVGPRHG